MPLPKKRVKLAENGPFRPNQFNFDESAARIYTEVEYKMYEDPSWYSKLSEDYKRETRWVMERSWGRLNWDSEERILDVGCGSGDALYHVIRPALPADYNCLIGVDLSPKMVDYAKSKWHDPRVQFRVMDVSTEEDPFQFFDKYIREAGGFHKIFSFFCLQWVKDRRRMLHNLYSLLVPGGYVLVHLVVRSGVYNVWDKLGKSSKWSGFLKDVQLPWNDYIYMDDFDEVFCTAARDTGFSVVDCQTLERKNVFTANTNTDEEMTVRLRSVDPLVHLLPEDLKPDYLKEVLELVKAEVSPKGATDYTGMLVLLRK